MKAIPLVNLPDDYRYHFGPLLIEAYQQHGPIFAAHGGKIVYLIGPEANRLVLVSQRHKFSNHIGWGTIFDVTETFGNGLLTMDGEEHDQHRKVMNPAFAVNYMDKYLPIMNRLIGLHVARWAEQEEIDLFQEARKLTFDIAAQALTGLEQSDHFRELFTLLLNGPAVRLPEEEYRQWVASLEQQLQDLLLPIIEERRHHPTDDLFSILVQHRDAEGRPMSVEKLIAHVNILLVAGHETSTSLSTWLLYLLIQHKDYTQRILQEQSELVGERADPTLDELKRMKVLENALNEAERLYPPVANGPRGVLEDFDFHGYHVPAGTFVFYSILASHYLPEIFANPTVFDPDRFAPPREEHKKNPYALVGFGGGPRICIGINFAQIEIKALASHVLRHYTLEVVPDQRIAQVYSVTGWPVEGIRIRVKKKAL
ncbi:cytochrome P450 [Tengunoibacter tsumagoiensis]|uniref:Cytochrome P450 n=1 Tax=Tengunoibacter tsumagoiensis TaxID=2014871 RepID=A0A402A6N8_9CHLR|nr:cytochrome P450 [Tengunoibacter tsumagoiensis]GCE14696.1 cytochrome P450 [Tengunoibacter tsumagoiensis]